MSADRSDEFFRGYAAAINDLERAYRAEVLGEGEDLALEGWIARVREKFGLPGDDLAPEVGALMARDDYFERAVRDIKAMLPDGAPDDAAREAIQFASRLGRSMPS